MDIIREETDIQLVQCDGIIVGVYEKNLINSESQSLNDNLQTYLELDDFTGKKGQKILLYQVEGITAPRCVLVGLGPQDTCSPETVRKAAARGARLLQSVGAKTISLEAIHQDQQSTIEGVLLSLYRFNDLKTNDDQNEIETVIYVGSTNDGWDTGIIIATAQNFTRRLAEMPANIGTPTFFVEETQKAFEGVNNVEIIAHDENWARDKNMGLFLSVATGTEEPAKFLEIKYTGTTPDRPPVILVGKGITFDSGGISLKSNTGMQWMRGDCGGAAVALGTILAIARLQLPINLISLTPLTENMPSGRATKPTDVIYASNGKSVVIENTDAEGRLVLADALVYADTLNPHTVIDIATLTGSMMIALGPHYGGVYARSDELWSQLEKSGIQSSEKFWRMPLDPAYRKPLDTPLADLRNTRSGSKGGANVAAMFLSEFTNATRWAHLDIAGIAFNEKGDVYKPKGMTGQPMRALVQFVRNLVDEST